MTQGVTTTKGCLCNISKCKISELCRDCLFNEEITISLTMVKKKYKLTNVELDKSNIPEHNYRTTWTTASRYLIKDVHALSKKITKKLEYKNPKRKAYEKQDIIIGEIQEKREKIEKRFKYVSECLCDAISKYKKNELLKIKDKMVQVKMCEHASNLDISEDDAVIHSLNYYTTILNELIKREERKDLIEKRMKEMIKKKEMKSGHIKLARSHPQYTLYIENLHREEINRTCVEIRDHVNMIHKKEAREKKIERYLKKELNKREMRIVRRSYIYRKYIESGESDFKEMKDKLVKNTKKKMREILKETRERRIKEAYNNVFGRQKDKYKKIHQERYENMECYKKYIKDGLEFNKTFEKICESINKIKKEIDDYRFTKITKPRRVSKDKEKEMLLFCEPIYKKYEENNISNYNNMHDKKRYQMDIAYYCCSCKQYKLYQKGTMTQEEAIVILLSRLKHVIHLPRS